MHSNVSLRMAGVTGAAAKIEWANPRMATMAPHLVADQMRWKDKNEVKSKQLNEDDQRSGERCKQKTPEEVEAIAEMEQPEVNECCRWV